MECGNKLSEQAKFCGGCGKPAENFSYKEINSNGESSISNETDLSGWVKIGRQYNLYVELSKGKSPDAQAAIRKFYKMLWNEKLVRALTYTTVGMIGFGLLIGVVSAPNGSISSSNSTDSVRPSGKTVTINEGKFSYSLFAGADEDGKTKEAWLLDLDGAKKVKVVNAFVYGKDTSGSSWDLLIGDNTPRIICQQETKEAKQVVANMTKKMSDATLEGDYSMFSGNKLYLKNCFIK